MEDNDLLLQESPKKNRKSKIFIAVVLTAVISVFISFLLFITILFSGNRYLKLRELDFYIDNYFYGEANTEKINDAIYKAYAGTLGDKYAAYYNAEETALRTAELSGDAKGIGIIVTKHPDTGNIYIKQVYDNCPAFKAGIKCGDQITAIDGKLVAEIGYEKSVNSVIRTIGETVNLTILRDGKTFNVTAQYSEFSAQSVFYKLMKDNIGYVEITTFNAETVPQFENAINKLSVQGAKSLVFDLRSNGGGTVSSVSDILDVLVGEGTIMSVKYADGKTEVIAKSDKEEIDLPMVVLTNEATASASELFTATIKDFGKGISVGSKTFGKGVMQNTYMLSDGSSIVFTVAEYLSNSGTSINEKGISPDIEVVLNEEQLVYFHQMSTEDDPVYIAAAEYLKNYEK